MPGSTARSQRSSSSVGSASSAFLDKLEAETSGADILDNSSALQAGIFGVLFTVTKEKYNTGWRFLTLKLVLDYLQLFTLTFTNSEPWVFDEKNVIWKVAGTVNIDQVIAPLGYNLFITVLYVMIGLLVLMMGLSLWVAWCFKNRSFPSVWPIKVLRVYANLFFQVLDVLTLTLFQVPFNCRYIGYPKADFDYMANYPEVKCSTFPHIVHMVTSGCALLVFVVCALLNLGADFELSPLEKGLLSVANGEVEVQAFVIKFAMTFASYAIGWQKVRLVLLLMFSSALTWIYLRWSPHLVSWVNHLRVGLYTSVLLSAVLAVVLVHPPAGGPEAVREHQKKITTLLWALIGPAALLGAGASYCRLNLWSAYVLKRFRVAPIGEKARRIYKFGDPREVEIVSRVCRKWVDQHREVLDRKAVKEGEIIIKAGLQLFPGRCYMLILYSNYLIDVLDNSQTGYSQMAAAKQANPGWMQRFAIFAREQEQLQRMSSARGGDGGVDLVSYVEYQKNHRLVIRAHKDALIATRTFWQVLLHNNIKFTALAAALNEIERTVLKAESAYKLVLGRYPTNAKLARTYARFLENVVNNPWKAAKYYVLAERLAEMQEADEAAGAEMAASGVGEAAVENRLLHRVDERVNAVFIINANGIIQMANKNACSLLGYGKGELDGKNINVIMPPPFSQRHNKYVRQYVHTGREILLNTVVSLPALHMDRYVIPVRVGVTKVSGAADSSTFMGVLEPISVERNEAHVYLLPGGTVAAVDRNFVDWFAKELDDCIAQHLADLSADEGSATAIREAVERIALASRLAAAASAVNARSSMVVLDAQAANAASAAARDAASSGSPLIVYLRHKYARPVRVTVQLHHVGAGSELLLCATLTRTDPPDSLILVDGRGRIGFITSELAEALGATPEGLARQPIADLLPQPWNALHISGAGGWLREAEASLGNVGADIQGDHQTQGGPNRSALAGVWGGGHGHGHGHGGGGGGGVGTHAGTGGVGLHGRHGGSSAAVMARDGGSRLAAANSATVDGAVTSAPPGSCLAGNTVVLGSSSKVQDYYRVEVSSRGETPTGQPMRVVMVRRSSLPEALNERRLGVVVDAATGKVLEAGNSPSNLFGFKPSTLIGRNIADVITALRPGSTTAEGLTPRREGGHPGQGPQSGTGPTRGTAAGSSTSLGPMTTTQLLCQLAVASMAGGGTSWRVGVTPPMDERNLEALGHLRGAFLSRQTRAAVMEVDVLVPGAEEDGASVAPESLSELENSPMRAPSTNFNFGSQDGGADDSTPAGAAGPGKSILYGPTFKEMHERGLLSVEAAAKIESGLTALTAAGAVGPAAGTAPGSSLMWGSQQSSDVSGLRLRVNLWRSEVLSGVLEVDGQGEVVTVAHAKLHQAGLLFGISTAQLPRMRLSRLLHIPSSPDESHVSTTAALFQPLSTPTGPNSLSPGVSAVRTALKSKTQKVGPLQVLMAHHVDGQPLEVAVQAVVKEGSAMSGRTLVFIKLRNAYKALDQRDIIRALEAVAPKRLLRAKGRRGSAVSAHPSPLIRLTAAVAAAAVPPPLPPGNGSATGPGSPDAIEPPPLKRPASPPDWSEECAVALERGAAVGTGGGGGPVVPDPSREYSGGEVDGEGEGRPDRLRGPAVLGSDSDHEGTALAKQGDAAGPHSTRSTGGDGKAAEATHLGALAGSKDSDDVMMANATKYDRHAAEVTAGGGGGGSGGGSAGAASPTGLEDAGGSGDYEDNLGGDGFDDDGDAEGNEDNETSDGERPQSGDDPTADGEYRSVASSSSTSSGDERNGKGGKGGRRRSSNNMRVSLDLGVGGASQIAAKWKKSRSRSRSNRRRSSNTTGGGRAKAEQSPTTAGGSSRRVVLNTPSIKKREETTAATAGGSSGGTAAAAGDRSRSPPPNKSSRRVVSSPRQSRGGAGAASGADVFARQSSTNLDDAEKSGGPLSPGESPQRTTSGIPPHPEGDGGLFGDLRSAILSSDGGAAGGGAGGVSGGGYGGAYGGAGGMPSPGAPLMVSVSPMGPGPLNDPDETGSQGSAMSGMEEEISGATHQADYRRGKRFKKLAAMLGSTSVQRAAMDFRWQALLANVAQVVSNLISFVLLTMLLRAQINSVERLSYTAIGFQSAHELFIDMVMLDNIHRGLYPNTSWYNNNSLSVASTNMHNTLVHFSEHHSTSYLDSGGGQIDASAQYNPYNLVDTWNYPLWPIVNFFSVEPPRVEIVKDSVWQLGNDIVERALDVHHRQLDMAAIILTSPRAALTAPLRNSSGPSNGNIYTNIIVARHLAGAYETNGTLPSGDATLTTAAPPPSPPPPSLSAQDAYAAAVAAVAAGNGTQVLPKSIWQPGLSVNMTLPDGRMWTVPVLMPGVSWTDAWRYVITAGTTKLYEGYHHTLLALVDRAVTDSNNINRVQLVLMLVEGCAVATLLVAYMWWLQHRVTQQRYRVYGVFMAVPVGMIRALASRTITISQGSDSEDGSDDDDYQQQQAQLAAAKQPLARQVSGANSSGSFQSAAGLMGFITTFRLFRSASNVGGYPQKNQLRGKSKHNRRRLIRNSRDSLKLLIPFVAWGITICVIYATGYYYLHQVQAPVNLLSVIDSALVSVHRLVLYALMTCSEVAAPAREVLRGLMAEELKRFKLEWDIMLYGANHTTSSLDRRYGRIREGVTFITSDMASVLFRRQECDLYGVPGQCPLPKDPFFAVSSHGLSNLVDRLIEDVEGLLAEPLELANINSTRLSYMYNIGLGPLKAAFEVVHDHTVTIVDNYYKVVDQLHIAAMVLSWVLVVSFVFLMLRPFLRRNRGETNRIAKMLSQLPAEVDIEGLVYRLLLGTTAMRKRNRRASVSSLIAEDPVLAAKIASAEAQAERMVSDGFMPFIPAPGGSTPFSPGSGSGEPGTPTMHRASQGRRPFGEAGSTSGDAGRSSSLLGVMSPGLGEGSNPGMGLSTPPSVAPQLYKQSSSGRLRTMSSGSFGGETGAAAMVVAKGYITPFSPPNLKVSMDDVEEFGGKMRAKGAWV